MDYLKQNRHTASQFSTELEQAMNQLMTMGGKVEQQLKDALNALDTHDEALAMQVIKQDGMVDQMEVDISEACITIIARRQPTASDLRLLIVMIKTISELERLGDVARKVSKAVLKTLPETLQPVLISLVSQGRHGTELLHKVLDSFVRMDMAEAVRLFHENSKLNQEHDAIVRQLMTYMMEDPRTIPDILSVLNGARSLSKIGDRCQNICEYIVYYVKGEDIRHQGSTAMAALLEGSEE